MAQDRPRVDRPYYFGRRPSREIEAKNGLYVTTDGAVSCLVHGEKIACTNGAATAQCDAERCQGSHVFHPDSEVDVELEFAYPKHRTVLGPSAGLLVGRNGPYCRTYGTIVRCRKGIPDDAGFSIDAYFIRVESYMNVADGWPWDGKCHNPFETE